MTKAKRAALYFKKHLNPSEKLLWAGIPSLTPYTIPMFCALLLDFGWLIYFIHLRLTQESLEAIFKFLYISPLFAVCFIATIFFVRKDDHAYGFSEQRLFIKQGVGNFFTIDLQNIQKVEMEANFIGGTFYVTSLADDNTINTYTLHSIVNSAEVYSQLNSLIKK